MVVAYTRQCSSIFLYVLLLCPLIATEKEMATHSSILAWRILWTEEPAGLLSMGLHRVRHDWSNLACMHALEKEVATHSSVLAWRIPGTEEPGGLPSVGSHRAGHDWCDLAAAAAYCYRLIVIVASIPTSKRPKLPSFLNQFLQPVVLSLTSLFPQAYEIWG